MSKYLLGLVVVMGLGSPAFAYGNRYAVVTVSNTSNVPVAYAFKWGNGTWKINTLLPGERRWHSWGYDYEDQHHSPTPYIAFYGDPSNERYLTEYCLEAYGSPYQSCDRGRLYEFRGNYNYLELYRV